MEEPKIKPQYKLVAQYYCGEALGNAEKAVVMAGYSKTYARGNAYKIVARKDVQEYIKFLNSLGDDLKNSLATAKEVQKFWSETMRDTRHEIKDRIRASELLAKAQGQFVQEW